MLPSSSLFLISNLTYPGRDLRDVEVLKELSKGEMQSFIQKLFFKDVRKLSVQVSSFKECHISISSYQGLKLLDERVLILILKITRYTAYKKLVRLNTMFTRC